jgi:hypothetical protein
MIPQQLKDLLRPSNQTFIRLSAAMGRFNHPVWIIGAGRSGTTWLSDLLRASQPYRFLFEPFHSSHNPKAHFLPAHQYLRPGDAYPLFDELADSIFDGKTYIPRYDHANKFKLFHGMLAKDITANMVSFAVYEKKPEIDLILLIRNPFAVALSRQKKMEWNWFNEPILFLKQQYLFDDYLMPFDDLIRDVSKIGDYFLNQILIWSIIHYVPLQQFSNHQMQVVFYEDLLLNTDDELQRLKASLRNKGSSHHNVLEESIKFQPSRTTNLSSDEIRDKSPEDWMSEIDEKRLAHGRFILKQFGLQFLYDESGFPAVLPTEVLNKRSLP